MRQLPEAARRRLEECLEEATLAAAVGDSTRMWRMLEDAHVLSQPSGYQHVRVHIRMLLGGWQTRDRAEVLGQVVRLLVAAPGSWSGRYPVGNTGRAGVPATQEMPIRPDLEVLLGGG